ncbi:MAG: hypothetical protein RSA97_00695 [Oscillospiraceae bacterium]
MIKIVTAYADLMNQYGEYAASEFLRARLESAGIQVKTESFSIGSRPELSDCNLLCFSAGTEKSLLAAMDDAAQYKAELSEYTNGGGFVLLTGNSMGIFAKSVTDLKNKIHRGLGILDCEMTIIPKRKYSELILQSAELAGDTVGAINTSLSVSTAEKPLFKVVYDSADALGSQYEGMVKNNVFATQLTGPMLVRNPLVLEEFCARICGRQLPECTEKWYAYSKAGYEHVYGSLKKSSGKQV